jgi:eukaryotic-like serine/threonine-protein kinase
VPLASGSCLGHYEVLAPLGAGGMGEVYRARDTKLGREVAIKVLPPEVAEDDERLARFRREAQLLASLNHPHIAAIHGLDEADGKPFLVLELVEGETLQGRLDRGRIPLDDALPIASQIAEALEEAHEHGIVHRDLKPANVKLTPEGQVKVLDFGLAKAFGVDGEASPSDASRSPTLTREGTEAGVIVGSAAYMSPEQARGKRVDRRADIWAFGVVLFEMLTGRRLFQGETVTDTLAAVLKTEPEWGLLPAETPARVQELLRRCLERDPKQRLRDVGDARLELQAALDPHDPGAAGIPVSPRPALRIGLLLPVLGAGVVLGALLAAGLGRFDAAAPAGAGGAATWVEIGPPRERFAFHPAPAVSPDARNLAFWAPDENGKLALWIRPLDAPVARLLERAATGYTYGVPPFWSPDGRSLAFFADGKLKRVDLSGGAPLTLADAVNPRGGTWGAGGVITFVPAAGQGVYRVSASGGDARPLPLRASYVAWPHFLPDGRHFLLTDPRGKGRGVVLAALDDAEARPLLALETRAEYADGHVFFGDKGRLFAQRFDLGQLALSGEPFRVADDLGLSFGEISAYAFSVSPRGTLVYWSGRSIPVTQLTWFSRSGQRLGTLGDPGEIISFAPSPTSQEVAFEGHDPKQGEGNVWLLQTATGVTSKLSPDLPGGRWAAGTPVWSPEGDRVFFVTFPGVAAQSLRGGEPEKLSDDFAWLLDVSPDGRNALLSKNDPATSGNIWLLPLHGGPSKPYIVTRQNEDGGRFSPDGRWVAYLSDESGQDEVYVQSFPVTGRPVRISHRGGTGAEWRSDGKELYYRGPDDTLMVVAVESAGSQFRASPPRPLFRVATIFETPRRELWASADGQRFLVNARLEDTTRQTLTLVLDWKAGLKAR